MNARRGAVVAVALLAMTMTAALPAAAARPEKATGDVEWSTTGGLGALDVHTTFVAHGSNKGTITNVLHNSSDGSYVETWSGTVTCFVRDGDMAVFRGEVDESDRSDRSHLTHFEAIVWDNGEGHGAVDEINSNRGTSAASGCASVLPPRPVTDGNLQVHY